VSDSETPQSLPIFPLSNVVLFPRVRTPLHLFEPRYRQLAREALAGERRVVMAVVRPEHVGEMGGDPPLFPVACCGVIEESQQLPDGRYNLVLHGERRVRITGEEPADGERLYRVGRVEGLEDPYPDAEREGVARLRTAITEDVGVLMRRNRPDRAHGFDPELFGGVDDETFVNAVANAFAFEPLEKQGLLEADGVPERYARLAGALSFRRAETLAAHGDPGRRIH